MDELLNYRCIDFKKLLILKAKGLKMSDRESYILLMIMTMEEVGMKPITPSRISEFCQMSVHQIDVILMALLDKNIIARRNGSLDLKPLYQMLLNQEVKKEEAVDLVSVFENAFGRSFSQAELGILQTFKTSGFDDQMILDALNESVKSGVVNFRYIEKILDNWSRYGVKKRFAPAKPTVQREEVSQNIKEYNWWDAHE